MTEPSKKPTKKKQKRTQYTDEYKKQAVRLWETGDYESHAALARHLKMKSPRVLSNWIDEAAKGRAVEGIIVLKKLEASKIERYLSSTIVTAQDTLAQLEPKDRVYYALQLIDRLTELRKNLVILPSDFDDGTGIISDDDALKIMAMVPEGGRAAFINALKDAKKL